MSYLVFARKWRPLTFEDVVGQQHITDTLKRAIEKDRVAHAYIFTGTRGVGKTTSARILARALNCDQGPTPNPCGTCESCQNIINGSSFDVMEIDGASNNGVDNIRELRDNLNYNSMGGKFRIIVIDEVHMLSKGAFNALLKTLEEPPKNVIFIFATTEPQKIPDTIHSRCQRYDFRRISTEHIAGQLERICTKEQIPFDKGGLTLIARRADGSMRDSLSLLDQVYSFCSNGINETEVRSVLGLVEMDVYNTILDAAAANEPAPALLAVEDVLNRGFDLLEFVTGFQEYLRTLLFTRLPGVLESQRLDISRDTVKLKTETASKFSEGDLLRMAEILKRCEAEMKWSAYPRFLVETTLLKIVYMDCTVTIQSVIKSLKSGEVPEDPSHSLPSHLESIKKKTEKLSSTESHTPVSSSSSDFVNPFKKPVAPEPKPTIEQSGNKADEIKDIPSSPLEKTENVVESEIPEEKIDESPEVQPDTGIQAEEPAVSQIAEAITSEPVNIESVQDSVNHNDPETSEKEVIPSDNYPDPAYIPEENILELEEEISIENNQLIEENAFDDSHDVNIIKSEEPVENNYPEEKIVEEDAIKEQLASSNRPEIEKESFQPVEREPVKDIAAKWKDFLEFVSEDKINLGTFLSAGDLAAVNENSIDIRFPADMAFQHQEVSKISNRDFLLKKVVEFTGKPMELHFTVSDEMSKKELPEEKEEAKEKKNQEKSEEIEDPGYTPSLEDEMKREPVIKNIIDKFNGKVL